MLGKGGEMRKLSKGKYRWIVGLVTAMLITFVCANAVFGSDQTTTSVPAPPESGAQAPPPLTGYQPSSGPLLSDEKIAEVARSEAVAAGEESPSMSAVDSTFKSAEEAGEDVSVSDATPGMAALAKSEVVVVTLHGQFTLESAPVPKGRSAPSGSVLTLVIDAHTGWIDSRELTDSDDPGISALGNVRALR
jgi:hypothetical protein